MASETTDPHPAPASPGTPTRRRALWTLVAALVTVGIAVAAIVQANKGETVPEVPAMTAEQSRDALTAAMQDAITAIDLATETIDRGTAPLTCELDGEPAHTLFLVEMRGAPVPDIDATFATIRGVWEEHGLDVQPRGMGEDLRGLAGIDAYGGTVYVLSGKGATIFSGESACRPDVGN